MRLVLQRVREAEVRVDGAVVGATGPGLLALVGFGAGDGPHLLAKMADKMVGLRIFADENAAMNRSVEDIGGGLLLVSQFTLYADCRKGRRPSFTASLAPEAARALFDDFVAAVRHRAPGVPVATGVFGAMMDVHLVNDGPVTIVLDSADLGL